VTITVIFGAGASYDSDREEPARRAEDPLRRAGIRLRPPLATNLFSRNRVTGRVLDELPVLQGAAARLVGLEGAGVEDELGRLQDEAAIDPIRAKQLLAARLYLRSSLRTITEQWWAECHGVTSYAWLHDVLHGIQQGSGEDLCYLTFNYDRLLDQAVEALHGVRFTELQHYVDLVPGVELHKLHGSLDWGWAHPEVGGWAMRDHEQQTTAFLLDNASRSSEVGGGEILVRRESHEIVQRDRQLTEVGLRMPSPWIVPYVPALAVPVRHKYGLVLPDPLIERMKQRLEMTTRLIIIGWRAQEDHVLSILRRHLLHNQATLIVDRDASSAAEREQALQGADVRLGHVERAERGFSELRTHEVTSFVTMSVG